MADDATSTPAPPNRPWDALGYDERFGFVARGGAALIDLLDPQPGERVLDLGCGTGELTADLVARGAEVVALDSDPAMVATARERLGADVTVVQADGHAFDVGTFDAMFSNAALHWMTRPDDVWACIRRSVRAGGRVVAEQGGVGNVHDTLAALDAARSDLGLAPVATRPWSFPSPGEHAMRLERHGFVVRMVALFDRPSPLEHSADGLADWGRMFGRPWVDDVPADAWPEFVARVRHHGAALERADGVAVAD
jgi:trans-aconitate methyltransferase